jgi:hypothetical protein
MAWLATTDLGHVIAGRRGRIVAGMWRHYRRRSVLWREYAGHMSIMRSLVLLFAVRVLLTPAILLAHCDTMDGPVVTAARRALDNGNLNPVLPWVQEQDVPEVRSAFERTLKVRGLGPEAREIADRWFFETVVRVHRAGEGAPYAGLKPAGHENTGAIAAADKALKRGSLQPLVDLVTADVRHGIHEHFERAKALRDYPLDKPERGREFVKAYVEFIHYVERLHQAANSKEEH